MTAVVIMASEATGNTLPTFPKTIYSWELSPAGGRLTKTCGRCDLLASVLACKVGVVGLD